MYTQTTLILIVLYIIPVIVTMAADRFDVLILAFIPILNWYVLLEILKSLRDE